jgi:lauroyl/myristoyl acyltransferase
MPFKSKKQETYLKINEPKVYKKWKKNYKDGGLEASEQAEEDFRASTGKIKNGKWVPHKKIKENRKKMLTPKDLDIKDLYQSLNNGGMVGCPMDGAVMKGGTKIKPDRYKHGKREV